MPLKSVLFNWTGAVKFLGALCLLLSLSACATINYDAPKQASRRIAPDTTTQLGKFSGAWQAEHGSQSGFVPLIGGKEALQARIFLAERSEKTLDLQYFLAKDDSAGLIFAQMLLEAADRGVRVRFLLDDVFTTVPDKGLMQLDQHPNIELRIFNPISRVGFKWGNYARSFRHLNRRMHNKIFVADGALAIAGGRNIADEYYHILTDDIFLDFDVLAVGDIVGPTTASFDEYWNHKLAVPVMQLRRQEPKYSLEDVRRNLTERAEPLKKNIYGPVLKNHPDTDFLYGEHFFPAPAAFAVDSPDKLLTETGNSHRELAVSLGGYVANAKEEVVILSPYFIPGKEGVKAVARLVDEGKRVIVVTNSLASNNHMSAYSAYARYRKHLLRAGADIYEMKVDSYQSKEAPSENGSKAPDTTLHTKALIFDQNALFSGSVNLDPRSINLNSELGMYIPSQAMTEKLLAGLNTLLKDHTYKVTLDKNGDLEWRLLIGGEEKIYKTNPQTSFFTRFQAGLLRIVPEGQL